MDEVGVLCVGVGAMGRLTAQHLSGHPRLRLLGGVDVNPQLIGRTMAEVVGDPRVGDVPIVAEPPPSPEAPAVAVLLTSSRLTDVHDQLLTLVQRGWNVISTSEELAYPHSEDPDVREAVKHMDAKAHTAGVTVVGTGINPGFLMDVLPLVLALASTEVRAVRVRRAVDVTSRRVQLQRKVGAGLTEAEFRRGIGREYGHVGLLQSAQLIAAGLDAGVLEADEMLEPLICKHAAETGLGIVEPGAVAGQQQSVRLRCERGVEIALDLVMGVGVVPVDEVTIEGRPPIIYRAAAGVSGDEGTAAIVTNMVLPVARAAPGLRTCLDFLPTQRIGDGEVVGA